MKYDNLSVYLNDSGLDSIRISFAEIESLLGFPLPHSAYTYNAWWANGGHTQADAWMNVGYRVNDVSLPEKYVVFRKASDVSVGKTVKTAPVGAKRSMPPFKHVEAADNSAFTDEVMNVCGYPFRFLQEIIPACDEKGQLIDYYPQDDYPGRDRKRLNQYGAGAFCRFAIDAEDVPGVYLWVVDGGIIYIGETVKLRQRFNAGYGNIQPVNCYLGGQTTNCKMNKVVRTLFLNGKRVQLYFYQTKENKRVELELLSQIKTRYNVKDNQ